jgi:transcriptional regulator with XRE-family HTH domain
MMNSSSQPDASRGRTSTRRKLQASALPDIRQRLAAGEDLNAIARDYPVGPDAIRAILYGRNWNQGAAEEISRVRAERISARRAQRTEHGLQANHTTRSGGHQPRNEVKRTKGQHIAQEQAERNSLKSAFGHWLEQTRFEQKMNLAALASQTGISLATISRLERGEAQVTLMTVLCLCDGLQVSLSTFGKECLGTIPPVLDATGNREQQQVLTVHDLYVYLDYCRRDWRAGLKLLVDLLNRSMSSSTSVIKKTDRAVEEMETILTKASPLSSVLLDFPDLEASVLWDIARKGGVVTCSEVGAYLKHLRLAGDLTLQDLQQVVKIPFTVLGRLEQGVIERVKLATAIALDRYWRQEGRVLALFWSATRYMQAATMWSEEERNLVTGLLVAFRRLQQQGAHYEVWLVELREAITGT